VFLNLEDETGIVNVMVHPSLFQRKRLICISERYLLIKGVLAKYVECCSVKAGDMEALSLGSAGGSFARFSVRNKIVR
jgi:error-prone DNA polymerase